MPTSESAPRQHAYTGPALPQLPQPTHAERVRTLLSLFSVATLSSLSRKHPGFPFGSLMPFALDSAGERLVVVSCLDNLGKGAAGQAVQNLNGMREYPETAGLL